MSPPLRCSTGGLWPSWWPTLEPLRLTCPPCTTSQVPVLLTLQCSGQNTAVLTDVCPFCNSRPPILPEVGSSDRPSRHQVRDQRLRQGQSQCADEGRGSEHKSATIVLERRQWRHREVSKNREYYNGSSTKKTHVTVVMDQLVPRGSEAHVFFLQEPAASSWDGLWASVGSISCPDLQGRGSAHHGVGANGEDVKGHWTDSLHRSLRTSDLCWTTGTQTCKHFWFNFGRSAGEKNLLRNSET